MPRRDFDVLRLDVKEMAAEFKQYRHDINDKLQEIFGDVDKLEINYSHILQRLNSIDTKVSGHEVGKVKLEGGWSVVVFILGTAGLIFTAWQAFR